MPLPSERPASGSRFGPRTTRAMTSTITSSIGPMPGIVLGLLDERAGLGQRLLDRRRLVERAVRGDAVLGARAERVLVQEHGDRAGVARLDREDRARGAEERLALQPPGLAEVGADADVLEHERGREELVPDVGAGEVERRLGDDLALERAQRRLEGLDVRLLVGG